MIEDVFREVKQAFPEVEARIIPARINSFMVSRPFGTKILYSAEQLKMYKFSERALRGCLAHELAHKVQSQNMRFAERMQILIYQRFKWRLCKLLCGVFAGKTKNKEIENKADLITVERGFGKELIQFHKDAKIRFDKNRVQRLQESHLSIKEIRILMAKKGNKSTNQAAHAAIGKAGDRCLTCARFVPKWLKHIN